MLCAPRTLSAKARATNLGHGLGSRAERVAATGGVGVHVAGVVGLIAVGGTRHFSCKFLLLKLSNRDFDFMHFTDSRSYLHF